MQRLTRFSFVLLLMVPSLGFTQALFQTSGSWDVSGNWSAGNIGDLLTEDVTIDISKAAFLNNGFSYTIGNLDFSNNAGLTINTTGTLDVGQSGTPKNLTANNNATITVAGTLVVWGDLIVNNNLSWNISGSVTIVGNVILNNNATLSVTNGTLAVFGNFTGGSNTNVTITGTGSVGIDGTASVGNSSNLTGPPGSFHAHGCVEGGSSSFCSSGTLPIQLLFFRADQREHSVNLLWSTLSELNFDYFLVEKSSDGKAFSELGTVKGHGTTTVRNDYSLLDAAPSIGKSYYRLSEIDLDRSVTHVKIVAIDFTGAKGVTIFPNPVNDGQEAVFQLNFVPDSDVAVSIVDLRGATLSEFIMQKQEATLPVQLSNGTYLVTVRSNNFRTVTRMVVR